MFDNNEQTGQAKLIWKFGLYDFIFNDNIISTMVEIDLMLVSRQTFIISIILYKTKNAFSKTSILAYGRIIKY